MTKFAFEKQNELDFQENSIKIEDALIQIVKTARLKATKAELSRLTHLHRNSFLKRGWNLTQKIQFRTLIKPEGTFVFLDEILAEIKLLKKTVRKKPLVNNNITAEKDDIGRNDPVKEITEKLNSAIYENAVLFNELQEKISELEDYKAAATLNKNEPSLREKIVYLIKANTELREKCKRLQNDRSHIMHTNKSRDE